MTVPQVLHTLQRRLTRATGPRYGFDSVSAQEIYNHGVRNPAFVCGYASGLYAWTDADFNLFPKSVHVYIATEASVDAGDVLDVESGAATPAEAESWIRKRKAAGYYRPTIYCSLATVPAVRTGTGPYKLGVDYDLWVAHWTGKPHVAYPGAAATQYQSLSWADRDVAYDAGWPHRKRPGPVQEPVLRPGATGAAVRTLQNRLNALDHAKLAVDGVFGPQTEAAVKAFQRKERIAVDGVVGPQTWSKLGNFV
jgi:hypothetical protein